MSAVILNFSILSNQTWDLAVFRALAQALSIEQKLTLSGCKLEPSMYLNHHSAGRNLPRLAHASRMALKAVTFGSMPRSCILFSHLSARSGSPARAKEDITHVKLTTSGAHLLQIILRNQCSHRKGSPVLEASASKELNMETEGEILAKANDILWQESSFGRRWRLPARC